jgi:hypothetical protein
MLPVHLEKFTAEPSVSKKYLHLGPSYSKHPENSPKIPKKFPNFAKAPVFCAKPLQPLQNSRKPQNTPEKTVLPLKAFIAHIFRSKALFSVILTLRFIAFTILSILAFIHNKLLAALYLFVYCVLCVRKLRAEATVCGFPRASL